MSDPALLTRFFTELQTLSAKGGWVFWPLIALAFLIAYSILTICRAMTWHETKVLSSRQWKRLFKNWEKEPSLLEQIRSSLQGSTTRGIQEIEQALFAKPRRRLPFAFVLVETAPLAGLLGTVSGMTTTFQGLASTSQTPIETMSNGISEALIATEIGLIIGITSFVACTMLKSRLNQCELTFRRIEVELSK